MTTNRENIREILYTKQEQLIEQLRVRKPNVERLLEAHERKQKNAKNFLDELEIIIDYLSVRNEIKLASSITEFLDYFRHARAKKVLFNGRWCKACIISSNFRNKKSIILYVASVGKL